MNNLESKLKLKDSSTNMWQTQAGKFTTNDMSTVDFWLPEFSATKIVAWKYHAYDSTKISYYIIPGRDLLTALWLDIAFYDRVIIGGDSPYTGCSSPMCGVIDYNFKPLTEIYIKLEESFINLYVKNASSQKGQLVQPN